MRAAHAAARRRLLINTATYSTHYYATDSFTSDEPRFDFACRRLANIYDFLATTLDAHNGTFIAYAATPLAPVTAIFTSCHTGCFTFYLDAIHSIIGRDADDFAAIAKAMAYFIAAPMPWR